MAKDLEKKSKKEKKHFFKDFKAELKKVIWPTPKQVVNNTIAVITIVLITAVIVFALDFVFKAINTYGIDAIRSVVSSGSTTNTTDSESSSDEIKLEQEYTKIDESETSTEPSEVQSSEEAGSNSVEQ